MPSQPLGQLSWSGRKRKVTRAGWPFKCPPPPDLTCRLPIGWEKSAEGSATLARGWEKWIFLKASLEPAKAVELKDGQEGSVLRILGDQETQKGKGHGCSICNWNCERVFVPEARS